MAAEPNGQESTGGERLNRIEHALELMLNDHILFREEHKQLMTAQVLLTGSMERLSDDLRQLTQRVDKVTERVDRLGERVDQLTATVSEMRVGIDKMRESTDQMRENFDMRLRRLAGQAAVPRTDLASLS